RFTAEVCAAYTEAATTGRLSPATADLLRRSSPATVTGRITAPTLLVQGEANARQIAAAGGPVKVIWYSGGHDGTPPGDPIRTEIANWFEFHLAGRGEDPGTGFGYTINSGIRAGSSTPTTRSLL